MKTRGMNDIRVAFLGVLVSIYQFCVHLET